MRSFFYSILLTSFLATGFFYSLKSQAKGFEVNNLPIFSYQINEISATGVSSNIVGESSGFEAEKIITDLGAPYYPEDKIKIFPDPKLKIGGLVTINRAPLISVKDGKRSAKYRSWTTTVKELFAERKIELGADDKTNVSLSAQIVDGSQIVITRVSITTIVETKAIDFQILQKEDPNLDYGRKRVEAGEKGEKKLTYRVRREDGDEVERTLIDSQNTKNPKSEIHYTGTKVTVLSSVRGDATIGPKNCSIVSANYKAGTLVRITNLASRAQFFGNVDCTWGIATAPAGVVLDLSQSNLNLLKWDGKGRGPSVLVEEIKQ